MATRATPQSHHPKFVLQLKFGFNEKKINLQEQKTKLKVLFSAGPPGHQVAAPPTQQGCVRTIVSSRFSVATVVNDPGTTSFKNGAILVPER